MTPLRRPFRPIDPSTANLESFDLNRLAADLVQEPQYRENGKAGIALARDSRVSAVLEVLRKDHQLSEHTVPTSALVLLLSGRASFVYEGGAKRTEMPPGTLVAFSSKLGHSLVAQEDSACLIVMGGRS